MLLGRVQNLARGHHHTEVDHFKVVALQDDSNDVLADVVDVALDCGHDDRAVGVFTPHCAGLGLLRLDIRQQIRNGLLHHPGRFHHLGQEHLACAKEVADDIHTVHQRALDHLDRAAPRGSDLSPQFFGVRVDVGVDTLDQSVCDAFAHRKRSPLGCYWVISFLRAVEPFSDLQEPLGRVLAAVQDDVFDPVPQLGVN